MDSQPQPDGSGIWHLATLISPTPELSESIPTLMKSAGGLILRSPTPVNLTSSKPICIIDLTSPSPSPPPSPVAQFRTALRRVEASRTTSSRAAFPETTARQISTPRTSAASLDETSRATNCQAAPLRRQEISPSLLTIFDVAEEDIISVSRDSSKLRESRYTSGEATLDGNQASGSPSAPVFKRKVASDSNEQVIARNAASRAPFTVAASAPAQALRPSVASRRLNAPKSPAPKGLQRPKRSWIAAFIERQKTPPHSLTPPVSPIEADHAANSVDDEQIGESNSVQKIVLQTSTEERVRAKKLKKEEDTNQKNLEDEVLAQKLSLAKTNDFLGEKLQVKYLWMSKSAGQGERSDWESRVGEPVLSMKDALKLEAGPGSFDREHVATVDAILREEQRTH